MKAIDELDVSNKFGVERREDGMIQVDALFGAAGRVLVLDEDQALVLAAHLVARASGDIEDRFSAVYMKVVAS